MLVEVADRLRQASADAVTIVRLGGDEFAMLLPNARRTADAAKRSQRIRGVLGQSACRQRCHRASRRERRASRSTRNTEPTWRRCCAAPTSRCGSPKNNAPPRASTAQATTATRPNASRSPPTSARPSPTTPSRSGFQPIKALESDQIINVEVLSRWEHPTRGLLPPPIYIEVAEQSDLIRTLTSYVLHHALEQRSEWATHGLDLMVSVNVSVHDLNREGFAAEVSQLLTKTATPDGRLVLELTETQALHHPERIAPVLTELRNQGVVVAIDDFGTGFSSLTSLRSLPVDEIKIDKSFVSTMTTNPHDNAIVRSIVELARRLDLDIVAEGVEDEATEAQLRELGCHNIQGYILTRARTGSGVRTLARTVTRIARAQRHNCPAGASSDRLAPRRIPPSHLALNRDWASRRIGYDTSRVGRPRASPY